MRPIEVHSVSMSFAPMVARLNSDGSVFFGPLAFGNTCQNARFPTAAMVGISQSPSPSSTSAGIAQSRTIGTRGVYAPDAVEDVRLGPDETRGCARTS